MGGEIGYLDPVLAVRLVEGEDGRLVELEEELEAFVLDQELDKAVVVGLVGVLVVVVLAAEGAAHDLLEEPEEDLRLGGELEEELGAEDRLAVLLVVELALDLLHDDPLLVEEESEVAGDAVDDALADGLGGPAQVLEEGAREPREQGVL